MKFFLLRKPRAVYLTHWILALIDSLAAFVTRWWGQVMMFSNGSGCPCRVNTEKGKNPGSEPGLRRSALQT